MPSIAENRARWTEYSWDGDGHEWSPGGDPAGGDMLWWRTVLPRIHPHLPAARTLEIGPGYGRWTRYLLEYSRQLTAVDVTERCIEYCRRRFADVPHVTCWTNDGQSLAMLGDASIDFVFSFDSLVHAEAPVMRAYIAEIARVLAPGGTGFLHHSNLGSLADAAGRLPRWVARRHWRGETMSARLLRQYCRESGLVCVTQELISWVGRSDDDEPEYTGPGLPLVDALSTVRKPLSGGAEPARVYVNPGFGREWEQILELTTLIRGGTPVAQGGAGLSTPARARRVFARDGIRGLASRLAARTAAGVRKASTRLKRRANARAVARHEPVRVALRRGRCPDCSAALSPPRSCHACQVEWMIAGTL